MAKGVSTSINKEERSALERAFEAEGPCSFEYATAFKFRAYDGHYVVVRLEPPGQEPFYADLARGATGEPTSSRTTVWSSLRSNGPSLPFPPSAIGSKSPNPVNTFVTHPG